MPWCNSIVDRDGTYTGVSWLNLATIAIVYKGAPGWRPENTQEFWGRAVDIWGADCWSGMGALDDVTGRFMERALTDKELISFGFTPAGDTVNAGFCYNDAQGRYTAVSKHSCMVRIGTD